MKNVFPITLLNVLVFLSISFACHGQSKHAVISGPRADNVELRNATIWMEVVAEVRSVSVIYYPTGVNPASANTINYQGKLGNEFNPIKIELNGLLMNTTYQYRVVIDGKPMHFDYPLQFTTKELWQWRKPAPDFSFLTGSCAYFNEPVFDRPGKPYGGDSSIFETMAGTKAAFHLWLGDNWYTRESDYFSPWGLWYRAHRDMSLPVLQKFMASMPQYAIWDDHDYGPNDEGKSFIYKDESRKVFMKYWCNPSYGENDKGIYTKVNYGDADFFLTDDRYFRSEDAIIDSINGIPNKEKSFFGRQQMDWLKNSLVYSNSVFKIIAVGSQALNPLVPLKVEGMRHYSAEFNELIDFITAQKITGVLFLSGDRHHSEVIRWNRDGTYPLYDVTISPYTAGISRPSPAEVNNPYRVPGTLVEQQNFARISISGKSSERKIKIDFIGLKGEILTAWTVSEQELK